MTKKALPGGLAHGLAIVLTLLMTVLLSCCCLLWQVRTVATDETLHTSIALSASVVDAQMARIEQTVNDLAGQYSFHPETVMNIVTREAVEDYGREVVAWWMTLLTKEPVIEAPEWDTSAVEAAVREDEMFQENTPSAQRRTIARDSVAYEVGQAVTRAVLPVRTVLLTLALPSVLERVDVPQAVRLVQLAPKVCAVAAAVVLLLITLLMIRRISKALMYLGAALIASALVMLGIGGMVWSLGIESMVGEVSTLLAMQLDLLGGHLMLQTGMTALVLLAVGVALMGVHQHDMNRLLKHERSLEA